MTDWLRSLIKPKQTGSFTSQGSPRLPRSNNVEIRQQEDPLDLEMIEALRGGATFVIGAQSARFAVEVMKQSEGGHCFVYDDVREIRLPRVDMDWCKMLLLFDLPEKLLRPIPAREGRRLSVLLINRISFNCPAHVNPKKRMTIDEDGTACLQLFWSGAIDSETCLGFARAFEAQSLPLALVAYADHIA